MNIKSEFYPPHHTTNNGISRFSLRLGLMQIQKKTGRILCTKYIYNIHIYCDTSISLLQKVKHTLSLSLSLALSLSLSFSCWQKLKKRTKYPHHWSMSNAGNRCSVFAFCLFDCMHIVEQIVLFCGFAHTAFETRSLFGYGSSPVHCSN